MIVTRKMIKKAMQKASASQKRLVDTADLMISHGKEFHPLTDKCDYCKKMRDEFIKNENNFE